MTTLTNNIAKAYSRAAGGMDTVTGLINEDLASNKLDNIGEAYGELLEKFGKRKRIPKADGGGFTDSTRADTFNTLVQRVTKAAGRKMKPAQVEESGKWTLVEVVSKPKAKPTVSLEKIRDSLVDILNQATDAEKQAVLDDLAVALGIGGEVVQLDDLAHVA